MKDSRDRDSGDTVESSAADSPRLFFLTDGAADDAARRVLGLTLVQRAELAARRAGYAKAVAIGGGHASGSARDDDWSFHFEEAIGRLVIAPATALVTVEWLDAAAQVDLRAHRWGHAPGRAIVVGADALKEAIAPADHASFGEIEQRLAATLGEPQALPGAAIPRLVRGRHDLPAARRQLLKALVKDTDGFMAKHVERPISLALTRWLAETTITPNQMTLVSVAFGLVGAPFFLSASPAWQTVGALLFLWHSILDGCDGELARLKFKESRWGGVLDYWGDNVVHVAIFACMAIGWSRSIDAGWPLILGVAAVGGTIGSACWVYFRIMRRSNGEGPLYTSVSEGPSEGLSKLLDGASRRDFIYLVVAAALFGKASWFLLMAAIGAPVFFILLMIAAARETRKPAPSPR